jgi:hypothetical protein
MVKRLAYHLFISLFLLEFFISRHGISLLFIFFLAKIDKKDASTSFL